MFGIRVFGTYAEVFKNPMPAEIKSIGTRKQSYVDASHPNFKGISFYVGGILTRTALYVWNRDTKIEHNDVLRELNAGEQVTLDQPQIPLSVYYYPQPQLLQLELAIWSLSSSDTDRFSEEFIRTVAMSTPIARRFRHIEVN